MNKTKTAIFLFILFLFFSLVLAVPGTDDLPSPDTSSFPNPNDSGGDSEDDSGDLRLETDSDEYFLQEIIELRGFGFSSEADNVEVNVLGTSIFPDVNDNGEFIEEYEIPITVDQGEYEIVALNHESIEENPTINITINYLEPELFAIPVQDNETPVLVGSDFLKNKTVTIEFESKTYEVETDEKGEFEQNLPQQQEGTYTAYAEQKTVPEMNATAEVKITKEQPKQTFYKDNDGDGYGSQESQEAITSPSGYVDNDDDCNDSSASIFPGAKEACNGFDNDCDGTVDNGATCTSGTCVSGSCVETTTTQNPPPDETNRQENLREPPRTVENQNPRNPVEEQPSDQDSGFTFWWLLAPLLFVVLLTGGLAGYLAYQGRLDLSSVEGFTDGFKQAFGMQTSSSDFSSSPSLSSSKNQTLINYIMKKRSEGYDDLAIRNALLKNKWAESEVDATFDSLYK